jgi:spore germination cell wall hydrolase CwlJ-like protein
MNAVDILRNVENYFDRNHNFFMLWGGLFAALFFGLFVPYNIHSRAMMQLETQQNANVILAAQILDMNHRMEFLELSYERKQKVMREVECLARNIYFEAGGEPRAGKIAVAEVTMNRVKSKQFPKTVCAVVHQKHKNICQFSWVCEGKRSIRNSSAWRESRRIAESILISKKRYGIIGTDAKYFHATYVNPTWADESRVIAQIGNHIFYR